MPSPGMPYRQNHLLPKACQSQPGWTNRPNINLDWKSIISQNKTNIRVCGEIIAWIGRFFIFSHYIFSMALATHVMISEIGMSIIINNCKYRHLKDMCYQAIHMFKVKLNWRLLQKLHYENQVSCYNYHSRNLS